MNDDLFENAKWVIASIIHMLSALDHPSVKRILQRLREQQLTAESFVEPIARHHPASRFFAETVAETMLTSPSLAAALASLDGFFNWMETHENGITSEQAAQCELIGPNGFFVGEDIVLGLMIMRPDEHFKGNSSFKMYIPLTGEVALSEPIEPRVIKTGPSPMLAIWSSERDTRFLNNERPVNGLFSVGNILTS